MCTVQEGTGLFDFSKPDEEPRLCPPQARLVPHEPLWIGTVTVPKDPTQDSSFLKDLCNFGNNSGFAFQAADLFMMMYSETNGTMSTNPPHAVALGLNQMKLSEIDNAQARLGDPPPYYTEAQYKALSRSGQMRIIVEYFKHYLSGGNYHKPVLNSSKIAKLKKREERAAVLYAANWLWDEGLNSAINNAPDGTLPDYTIVSPTKNSSYYVKEFDVDGNGVIGLKDLASWLLIKAGNPYPQTGALSPFYTWVNTNRSAWPCPP